MSEGAGEKLVRALGADVVALEPDAAGPRFTVAPRDPDELARALTVLGEEKVAVAVRGRGTRQELGNPLRATRGVLSTERLSGILEFDEQDGVLQVQAGTPLAEVDAAVRRAGWELPLDPPGVSSSVGGTIATAATGPRRQRYGAPKRAILGLNVALASGERTRCGGRVVKNVTGYDLAKLYAGSLGTLGVIESAWLRLRPAPAEVRTFVAMLSDEPTERTFELGLAASRRSSVRASALVFGEPARDLGAPTPAATVLVVECAADPAAVAADASWLAAEAGARSVPEEARLVGRLRDQQGTGELRARLAVRASDLAAAALPLRDAGLGVVVYPGAGLLYAIGTSGVGEAEVAAIEATAQAARADLQFEVLPQGLRETRDAFGDPGQRAPLLRALKQRFDPLGILNPGRGQGRL